MPAVSKRPPSRSLFLSLPASQFTPRSRIPPVAAAASGFSPRFNRPKPSTRSWTISVCLPALLPFDPPPTMVKANWNGLDLLISDGILPSLRQDICARSSSLEVAFVTFPHVPHSLLSLVHLTDRIPVAGASELPHTRPFFIPQGPLISPIRLVSVRRLHAIAG